MSRDLQTFENNDDGFWDAQVPTMPLARREVLRRLEPHPVRAHARRNLFTYIMAAMTVASVSGAALVIRNAESGPDNNEYQPERVNQRVLTSVEALKRMGLCEAELRAEAQYQRFLRNRQSPAATSTGATPAPEALDVAADLARDNNTPCAPGPAHNGMGAGAYQLAVAGGTVTVYPDRYTHFVAAPADAVCARFVALQEQRAATTDQTAQEELGQAALLQITVAQSVNVTCQSPR